MKNEFETKKVTVPLWDDYLEQTINVEALQKIYNKPFPIHNRRFFKSGIVCQEPKFHKQPIKEAKDFRQAIHSEISDDVTQHQPAPKYLEA